MKTLHLLLPAMVALALGCSASNMGTLAGKVTFEGQAVKEGVVHVYWAEKGIGAFGYIDFGDFALHNAVPAGNYAVYVTPPYGNVPGLPPPPRPPTFKHLDEIPKQYRLAATSPLKTEVRPGHNFVEFDLRENKEPPKK